MFSIHHTDSVSNDSTVVIGHTDRTIYCET